MEKEKKYAAKGMAAGSAMAGAPVAAGMIRNVIRKSYVEDGDLLSVGGNKIVNTAGKEILLQGIVLNEPEFDCRKDEEEFRGTMKDKFDALEERFGNYGAREIFQNAYFSFITPADIKTIAKMKLNCVVIPLRSFLLIKDIGAKKKKISFKRLDKIIDACRKNGVYAVLSMESAPGFINILPSAEGGPNLLGTGRKDSACRTELVKFWQKISEHYKENSAVAAYNILKLNPTGVSTGSSECLHKLYAKIIRTIRSKGDNHIIIAEMPDISSAEVSCGFNAENIAAGFSGAFSTGDDLEAFLKGAESIVAGGTPIIACGLSPFDLDKACRRMCETGISNAVCNYKGDNFCLYCGEKQIIDLTADSYDEIKEKLSKPLGSENYKENSEMSKVLGSIIDDSRTFSHTPEPVEIRYAGGKVYGAGI